MILKIVFPVKKHFTMTARRVVASFLSFSSVSTAYPGKKEEFSLVHCSYLNLKLVVFKARGNLSVGRAVWIATLY